MEKIKCCHIFEPTYESIMLLPTQEEQLAMFISMCRYAYYDEEPEYPDTPIGAYQRSLWNQLKLVTDQSRKRAKANSENGKKGGRPCKNDNEGLTLVSNVKSDIGNESE